MCRGWGSRLALDSISEGNADNAGIEETVGGAGKREEELVDQMDELLLLELQPSSCRTSHRLTITPQLGC